jgi:hypothetical protein
VALVVAWLAARGAVDHPAVHLSYDTIATRDAGTVWSTLTLRPGDGKYFLPVAILGHIEGPFQFVFLNAFYAAIGDALPLSPAVTQTPNTVFALATAGLLYLLGRGLVSPGVGVGMAVTFALMPWLGPTIRMPWVFNTASTLFQAATLLLYAGFVVEPERRLFRIGAPAALALYLTTGLDWPAFLLVVAVFLALAGAVRPALRNRWNALPAAVVAVYAAWTVALFLHGRWVEPRHASLYQSTMLLYPFVKAGASAALPPLASVAAYARDTLGLALPAAVVGALLCARPPAGTPLARPARAFFVAMLVWALVTLPPLLRTSTSLTYGYVAALAVSALAGLALASLPRRAVVVVAVTMAALQAWVTAGSLLPPAKRADRRITAAAAFLNEHRPDLLAPGKRALMPRPAPAWVGQYARGRNERIFMPTNFPAELRLTSVGSREEVLREFVTAYRDRGELGCDWLVLSSETVSDGFTTAAAFYRRLVDDPRIDWIAGFRGPDGLALWIGEVKGDGAPTRRIGQAPPLDTEALATRYERTYDHIGFLRRNVRHIHHY